MHPDQPADAHRAVVVHSVARRLGPECCGEIVRRYQDGDTAKALGEEFGVSKTAVLNLLRANRVVMRRRSLTDEQIRDLVNQYGSGKTIAVLEAETGISHGTIHRALKESGAQMRPRGFGAAR